MSKQNRNGAKRLLVMDDEPGIRDSLNRMLGALGYDVESARNGHEAIALWLRAKAAHAPFHAVIFDLHIEDGMGGVETVAKLRRFEPGLKAVVVSGSVNEPAMTHYHQYGFGAALPKPFDLTRLQQALQQVLA